MSDEQQLTGQQLRAARMVGQGWQLKDVADELDVHAETVSRWTKREDFQEAAKRARVDAMNENPEAVAVLESLLTATKADGSPDNRIRLDAARTLVGRKSTGGGAAPVQFIERRVEGRADEDPDEQED